MTRVSQRRTPGELDFANGWAEQPLAFPFMALGGLDSEG